MLRNMLTDANSNLGFYSKIKMLDDVDSIG
jgi:hypothetical protein